MPIYQNVDWINEKLNELPALPGCYIMRRLDNQIIYIGKAKNLRNRVRSYFRSEHTGKTRHLVSEIHHFETIVTQTDKEALLLEISLIQKYQPKYNIRLKEGTMYPYLKITKEKDPQLIITSTVENDGGLYFGPYPNVYAASETQQFIQKLYPLRRCGKHEPRACFYYHLGQCIGCCDHEVSQAEYQAQIQHISRFLNGETDEVKQKLTDKMQAAAEEMEFERAAEYRDQIQHINQTVERQDILSIDYTNRDVFNYEVKRGYLSIQVFLLRQSTVIKREAAIFPLYDTPEEEFLAFILMFYQQQNHLLPKEILIPTQIDARLLEETLHVKVHQPQRGKKKRLLDLAGQNSRIALNEKLAIEDRKALQTLHANDQLAEALGLPHLQVIEAFDHSHIQGAYPVSGMVVYENGQPNKKAYRKYHIKTVQQADEFKTTQEVIRRRYTRLLKEGKTLPDLIMMDGGIIQVRAAREVLEDELGLSIPVAGMVKNDKHQTASLIFGDPLEEVPLNPSEPAFQFVQRIQEEVHRFAITFHRQTRSKSSFASDLERIEGVGKKTRMKLYQTFKTREAMEQATLEDLLAIGINRPTSERLLNYFEVQQANRAIKAQLERQA